MANIKISELASKTTPELTDEIELQETSDGDSKKTSLSAVKTLFLSDVTLTGDATCWADLMIPGHSVRTSGNSPPDFVSGFAGDSELYLFNFDGNNTLEQVYFTIQLPHEWKQGSTIYPHIHFSPTSTNSGDANSRVVRFILEYTWANIAGTFGAKATLNLDSDPFVPNTSQWKHLIAKNASRNHCDR